LPSPLSPPGATHPPSPSSLITTARPCAGKKPPSNSDRADAGTLAVTITDAAGRPLDSATISAEAFHHAHARDKVTTTLTPTSPGQYTGTFAATTPGLWEFHFTVQRGPQTLTQTLTRTLAPQTPPLATEPHP